MLQLTSPETLRLTPGAKIIPAAEATALFQADAILTAARAESEKIIASAYQEFERQKQAGFEAGMLEGRMEMTERMMESALQAVEYFSGLESKVVDLVMKSLRKVLGEMDLRQRVIGVVRNALGVARNQPNVTLRVSPAMADMARESLHEITKPYPTVHYVEVVGDPRLSNDDCILETELGVVDASLGVQLKAISNSLVKSLGRNCTEDSGDSP